MKNILFLTDNTKSQQKLENAISSSFELSSSFSVNEAIYKIMNEKVDIVIAYTPAKPEDCVPFFRLIKNMCPKIKTLAVIDETETLGLNTVEHSPDSIIYSSLSDNGVEDAIQSLLGSKTPSQELVYAAS